MFVTYQVPSRVTLFPVISTWVQLYMRTLVLMAAVVVVLSLKVPLLNILSDHTIPTFFFSYTVTETAT